MHTFLAIVARPVAMALIAMFVCWLSSLISPLIPEGKVKSMLYKRHEWIKTPRA